VAENLKGKFIVLDGPDGCGKSTQCRLLSQWLIQRAVEVADFRDPGTTEIGERIRKILLNPSHLVMDTRTEVLLYMAARAQLWSERIKPALAEQKCVLLDRWLSSTCAYQGYAGGFGAETIIKIASDALERPFPDLTIILDLDLETSTARLGRQLDRMEQKPRTYHQQVRRGFLKLSENQPDFAVVDASANIDEVHEKITRLVQKRFNLNT